MCPPGSADAQPEGQPHRGPGSACCSHTGLGVFPQAASPGSESEDDDFVEVPEWGGHDACGPDLQPKDGKWRGGALGSGFPSDSAPWRGPWVWALPPTDGEPAVVGQVVLRFSAAASDTAAFPEPWWLPLCPGHP